MIRKKDNVSGNPEVKDRLSSTRRGTRGIPLVQRKNPMSTQRDEKLFRRFLWSTRQRTRSHEGAAPQFLRIRNRSESIPTADFHNSKNGQSRAATGDSPIEVQRPSCLHHVLMHVAADDCTSQQRDACLECLCETYRRGTRCTRSPTASQGKHGVRWDNPWLFLLFILLRPSMQARYTSFMQQGGTSVFLTSCEGAPYV
jgi:hypothetical protein